MTATSTLVVGAGRILADGPSDGQDFTAVSVSPGLAGFVAMFLIVLATLLLILDMTRRIRRSQARERVEQQRREQALQDAADREDRASGADPEGSASGGADASADEDPEGPGSHRA